MNDKDFKPMIMWFILVIGIIILTFVRINRMIGAWIEYKFNMDTIFACLYIFWMLIEFEISGKDVDIEGKKTADFATCQIYGVAQAITFFSALWFPSVWKSPNVAHFIGISIFLLGVCYRLWAISTLGQFYSHRVQTIAKHQIVVSGPYKFTRHPAYAGMIIANAGIAMYFFNWMTICIFLFILVPVVILRIVVEEKTLFRIKEYAEFAKNRKRLFPWVW